MGQVKCISNVINKSKKQGQKEQEWTKWTPTVFFFKVKHKYSTLLGSSFFSGQKFRLPGTSWLGSDLRVDAFRHDRNLIYGRCTTSKLSEPQAWKLQKLRGSWGWSGAAWFWDPGVFLLEEEGGGRGKRRENGEVSEHGGEEGAMFLEINYC